ncbi:Hypothetical predicted protein [Mytilus galloprovincialis]|uniref:Uncharacterized protein n=1 Tax=Mytilus galloprovincialis TaxID=29158 RepID=A0A8B6HGM3_MYTGA|nr:Hypothetical predicted protein [Mytilus galloprovincialis]
METCFTHTPEKITTQQANLFETKLSSIDKMYSKSLESHNEKFNMLMKMFEEMTTRGVTACKEAEQFKCQLKNVQHVNKLEQEVMKTKYETQISQSKLQGEQKLETIKKLDNEVLKLAANLTEQESKIQHSVITVTSRTKTNRSKNDTRDGVYLNESEIRVFASNLRDCIDNILGLPSRYSYNYGNRHPYDGQRDYNQNFRGRGRGHQGNPGAGRGGRSR